jgi:hypothetical protein
MDGAQDSSFSKLLMKVKVSVYWYRNLREREKKNISDQGLNSEPSE